MRPGVDRSSTDDPGPVSGWEVIDDQDVIGTASARLLSTCADRSDRLAALSLLGLLLDHADEGGHIRLPLDTLARELDVEPERVVRLLQRLVAVEAVRTQGDAVVVVGSQPIDAPLRPSRFLANLATVLEHEPFLAAVHTSRTARTARAMMPRTQAASKRQVLVALGVGLAAMILTTTPSGDPRTELRTVSAPADLPAAASRASQPGPRDTSGQPPVAGLESPLAPDPRSVPEMQPPTASDAREWPNATSGQAELQRDFPGDRPALPSKRLRPAATPPGPGAGDDAAEPDRRQSSPAPVPNPPAPPSQPPDQERTCPAGGAEATVSTSQVLGVWPGSILDPVDERVLQVTGTVTNDSEEAITIETIEVGAGEGTDRVIALAGPVPFTVDAGGTADWEARFLAGLAALADPLVDVQVISWSWADPDLDGCST